MHPFLRCSETSICGNTFWLISLQLVLTLGYWVFFHCLNKLTGYQSQLFYWKNAVSIVVVSCDVSSLQALGSIVKSLFKTFSISIVCFDWNTHQCSGTLNLGNQMLQSITFGWVLIWSAVWTDCMVRIGNLWNKATKNLLYNFYAYISECITIVALNIVIIFKIYCIYYV